MAKEIKVEDNGAELLLLDTDYPEPYLPYNSCKFLRIRISSTRIVEATPKGKDPLICSTPPKRDYLTLPFPIDQTSLAIYLLKFQGTTLNDKGEVGLSFVCETDDTPTIYYPLCLENAFWTESIWSFRTI